MRSLPLYGGLDASPRPDVREWVEAALRGGAEPAAVVEGVARVLDAAVARHAALFAEGKGPEGDALPACAKGCAHCCHQRVELTAPEVWRLARALRAAPDRARDMRVRDNARRLATMDGGDPRQRAPSRCALLGDDGACTAYDARPLACRRAHSLDASACLDALREPGRASTIPAAPTLTWNLSSVVLGYLEGSAHAGSPPDHYELHAALTLEADVTDGVDSGVHERDRGALAPAMTTAAADLPRALGRAGDP